MKKSILTRHLSSMIMYVFVYGTLKRNCPNNYMLENSENGKSEFICEAQTTELFPLIVTTKYDIPFVLDQSGIGNHVLGEVYAIDEKMLETLDRLEGYPDLYNRRIVEVKPTNGQEVLSAWVFTFHSFNKKLLEETFYDNYVCNNYDLLRTISATATAALYNEIRSLCNGIQN